MGVDLSITTAVGVILDEEGITAIRDAFDDEEEDSYWGEEILNWLRDSHDVYIEGVGYGNAGSYYDSDPMTEYIYVSRLSSHYSDYDLPGGIMRGPKDVDYRGITTEEHNRLTRIAQLLGTPHPTVQSFTAVLWH